LLKGLQGGMKEGKEKKSKLWVPGENIFLFEKLCGSGHIWRVRGRPNLTFSRRFFAAWRDRDSCLQKWRHISSLEKVETESGAFVALETDITNLTNSSTNICCKKNCFLMHRSSHLCQGVRFHKCMYKCCCLLQFVCYKMLSDKILSDKLLSNKVLSTNCFRIKCFRTNCFRTNCFWTKYFRVNCFSNNFG
jgi:hypothetical protein